MAGKYLLVFVDKKLFSNSRFDNDYNKTYCNDAILVFTNFRI